MRAIDADALMEIYADRMSVVADRYSPDSSECGILSGAMKLLSVQPTIEPEPHWISCSERPPDKDDEYFVTVDSRHIPPGCRSTDKFIWHDGKWVIVDFFNGDRYGKPEYKIIEVDIPVLAWMPLPQPYREGE